MNTHSFSRPSGHCQAKSEAAAGPSKVTSCMVNAGSAMACVSLSSKGGRVPAARLSRFGQSPTSRTAPGPRDRRCARRETWFRLCRCSPGCGPRRSSVPHRRSVAPHPRPGSRPSISGRAESRPVKAFAMSRVEPHGAAVASERLGQRFILALCHRSCSP